MIVSAEQKPLSAKMIRNVIFGAFRAALVLPIPFVLTPLILSRIGPKGYGTWAVFLAINNLTSLADLGLVGTLSKYVAEYYAQRDFAALNRLLDTGIALFTLLSLVVIALLWTGSHILVAVLFRGSSLEPGALLVLFRYFLILVGANILILLFSSVTAGLQRMDLTHVMGTVNVFVGASVGGFLLVRGRGLPGLLAGYVFAALLTLVIYVVMVRRLLPQLMLNPLRMDGAEAKKIFNFSLRLYLTSAAVAVHNQAEKIFLTLFSGVIAAGWYDIASDVALKIRGAVGLVLTPVLPAASELGAQRDERRLAELYYRSHKYLAFIGVPIVCYTFVISNSFVKLWLGPNLLLIARPLAILVLIGFVNLTTGPGFSMFAGSARLGPGMRSAALGLTLNVILSVALIYRYGFAGAVIGTSLSLVIASGYFLFLFHHHTGYSVRRLLRESYVKPVICSLLLVGTLWIAHPTGVTSWPWLVLQSILFGATYCVLVICSGFFDHYDRTKLSALVPRMRRFRGVVSVA